MEFHAGRISQMYKIECFKKNVIFSWNGEDCIAAHSPE